MRKTEISALILLLCGCLLLTAGCGNEPVSSDPDSSVATTTSAVSTTTADTVLTTTTQTTTATPTTQTTTQTKSAVTTTQKVTTTTTAATSTYPHVALDNPQLKYTGRTMVNVGEVWLDWSACGVEMTVMGGTVEAQLYGVNLGEGARVYMGVYIDGVRTKTFYLENGLNWYTLAENLPKNTVSVIQLVRLTEASMGKASLFDLKVTGKLVGRPANKPHKIEWIGDSLTCGYGVLEEGSASFKASTEDVTKTFAWLCSKSLQADISVVGASGYSIAYNYDGGKEYRMPEVFPYYNSISRDVYTPWDYSLFQPDLVVINLGTNDASGWHGSEEGAVLIREKTKAFLTALRAAYPKATLCWMYGFCTNEYGDVLRQTVEQFAATDGNAAYLTVPLQNVPKNGIGADGHPNVLSNKDCADNLTPKLKKLMNW